jgi:YfiH family protein
MMVGQITYRIFQNHPDILCQTFWQDQKANPSDYLKGSQNEAGFELLRKSHFTANGLAYAKQVHGKQVEQVTKSGVAGSCDGLATTSQNLPLVIRTADCAAVMIFNPDQKSIANLHVGWRGAHAGIIAAGIKKLVGPGSDSLDMIKVAVSPMIRDCCYEVGTEFYQMFEDKYLMKRQGKNFLQLEKVIDDQLQAAGILSRHIEYNQECTHCSHKNLPSYRKDKTKNRLINVIEMKE